MNIREILRNNYAGTAWTLVGEDYEGLEWLDETTKPTKAKLESEWSAVEAKIAAQEQAKIDAKASAIAKLQALGLTVEEVEAAFGLAE
jgi:uncharacterized protein YqfA (UPF0365 family)